jgi:hypothetical protein
VSASTLEGKVGSAKLSVQGDVGYAQSSHATTDAALPPYKYVQRSAEQPIEAHASSFVLKQSWLVQRVADDVAAAGGLVNPAARVARTRAAEARATLCFVKAEDIREFAKRQREPVQRLKRAHWASVTQDAVGLSALEAGHALYEHVRSLQPSFPSEQYLADDLEHHVRLKRLIDDASHAFTIRRPPR